MRPAVTFAPHLILDVAELLLIHFGVIEKKCISYNFKLDAGKYTDSSSASICTCCRYSSYFYSSRVGFLPLVGPAKVSVYYRRGPYDFKLE